MEVIGPRSWPMASGPKVFADKCWIGPFGLGESGMRKAYSPPLGPAMKCTKPGSRTVRSSTRDGSARTRREKGEGGSACSPGKDIELLPGGRGQDVGREG